MEATDLQLQGMAAEKEPEIHKVSEAKTNKSRELDKQCKFCGQLHAMRKELCPAWGKTCNRCKGKNHFAIRCKTSNKRVCAIAAATQESDEYEEIDCVSTQTSETIQVNTVSTHLIHAIMRVNLKPVRFQLDSGASVNLINKRHIGNTKITPSDKTLLMWNKSQVKPLGECKLKVCNPKNNKCYLLNVVVIEENLTPLLGAKAAQHMQLITVNVKNFESVAAINSGDAIIDGYASVFSEDIGTLPGTAHFQVDESVTPCVSPTHNVPVALKPLLKESLEELTTKGVIAPVDKPTDWVNNVVIAQKKNGKLRICLDPRPLNKALKRERYQLPVLNDILPELSNAKVFSTFDLSHGYWHVALDEESSLLTTFSTPFGRYRWLRLPFGTNVC